VPGFVLGEPLGISRYGRHRPFPIAGTAIAAVGLYLLSTLEVATATEVAAGYMLLLGLGLGLVMQVLVLAAQNAVLESGPYAVTRVFGLQPIAGAISRAIVSSIAAL
jgi:hypothetical protein